MTAAHAGAGRDAGTRARACADWRRGQVWFSRRLTSCGVHHRRTVEHCPGEDGHVTCGWSTDRSACVRHAYGWERWRPAAPARRRLRRATAARSRRQRRSGPRAADPPRAGVGWAGKALQKDGKYDSIHSPIVWWTHVCPQVWTGRHAQSPAKENRARARPPHARQVTCRARDSMLVSCHPASRGYGARPMPPPPGLQSVQHPRCL
jgi:hypothetical protein